MKIAIELSEMNVKNGLGGSFGDVIVKDGQIVAKSVNTVLLGNDLSAHAEIATIRLACKKLNTSNLQGCIIYTSCEPCSICLGAIYWAKIDKMYLANTKKDAANIGFDDEFIYQEIDLSNNKRKLITEQILAEVAQRVFNL